MGFYRSLKHILGGDTGAFSPGDLASLQAWYKETGLVLEATDIIGWNDSSGNAKNLVPLDARPQLQANFLNGFDVVQFTTAAGSVGNPLNFGSAIMAGTAATLFIVGYKDSSWGEAGFYTTRATGQANHHPFSDNNVYDANFSTARKSCGAQVVTISNNWRIFCIQSETGNYRMYIDGQTQHTTATNTFALGSDLIIGVGDYDGINQTYALAGYVAEVILFNEVLSTTNVNNNGNYLADRFNLTWANVS